MLPTMVVRQLRHSVRCQNCPDQIAKGLLNVSAFVHVWMEALLPKRRILELYANVIEMGRGIGVEAASQHYFGVTWHGLTPGAGGHADGSPAESEGLGSGEAEQDIALPPATYFAL